jgi:glycosyltransferase involved in cell wall biosynthesis
VRLGREANQARRHGLIAGLADSLGLPALTSPDLQALEFYARLDFTVVHGLPCYVHPDLRRFPSVVTMHDLQHLHYPRFFSPEDIATREREYQESCRRASHILCTSEFTRQDVHRRYGVPLDKMTVVWNLPPRLTGTPLGPAAERRRLAEMGVQPPFLFFPAQPWRHKNHHGLLEAVHLADRELRVGLRIVMTGQPLPPDHPATPLMQEPAVRRRVQHLGYRTPVEIAALYHAAEALVFPSLFEGFGMPVIEAMQQGCPVLCGRHSSLPEIAGDAAYYTDVTRPDTLAEALITITRDDELRAALRERGAANLLRFNRRELAEKTRAIYAQIHAQHFG